MTAVDVLNAKGKKSGSVELDDATFGIEPNVPVMHQVVTAQLAARRSGTQSTKTRAEVAGGGAKPWRQKGTGRARAGSSRSPAWKGGGVALGPKPRSYAQRTPKKMIKLALRSALSDRAAEGKVLVVDWDIAEPKTKDAIAALAAFGAEGHVLVVITANDEAVWKSLRNLGHVHLIEPGELNAYDVLACDWVIFTEETLPGGHAPAAVAEVEVKAKKAPAAKKAVPKAEPEVAAIEAEVEEAEAESEAVEAEPAEAEPDSAEPDDEAEGDGSVKDPRDVIIRPVVSEKSYALMDAHVYTFIVAPDSSKPEIHDAIEKIFSVKVTNVNTLNRKGKGTRNRRNGQAGKKPDTKRAIVTLADGDTIDLFEA